MARCGCSDQGASDQGASDQRASDQGASDQGASDQGASDQGASDQRASYQPDPTAGGRRRFDTIRTGRLLMRRWLDSDREPFAALNADPETMRFFPSTLDRRASDAFVDRIESRFEQQGYGLWALEVAGTGLFIGYTGLAPMPDGVPGAGGVEIGWRLARHAWHQGYATEAARAALAVAFGGAGLDEIWSMTAVLNEPSQAVMRRLGMTEVARFDHPKVPAGSPFRPHVTYHLARPRPT